jgi:hypothetical protein
MSGYSGIKIAQSIMIIGALLSPTGFAFAGDDVTAATIVGALQPKPLTRSLSLAPAANVTMSSGPGRVSSISTCRGSTISGCLAVEMVLNSGDG